MSWADVLVLLMLRLPAHHLDEETPEERRARVEVIAQAITEASARATCRDAAPEDGCVRHWPADERDLSVLLVTQAYWESRLARNVHEGRCRSYECDPYTSPLTGKIEHRSRSLWQLQLTSLVTEEWDRLVGTSIEATRNAAFAASKLLGRGFRACRTIPGAISRYAGVGDCHWRGAAPRHRQFLELRAAAARLEREAAPAP
ncbi:MAG TPA: hypothetical protein PLU22_22405 [Polyangiaceae bacterium]|nr:hypothetical protein [Polyangiaceae bacterium]